MRWEQGFRIDDLDQRSNRIGVEISTQGDIHYHAGYRFLPQRDSNSDPGDGEPFEFTWHRVGQRVRGALRDGDFGEHRDMVARLIPSPSPNASGTEAETETGVIGCLTWQ